ncbi:guanine-1-methyltransferase-domain-containing protein [Mycena floridula]|nr:guanine-1-methyltransferase-domain-containing protein [Mycena floridula]
MSDAGADPSTTLAPSKSSLKKAAKAERMAALKIERRAKEKEAKKEKKRIQAEKRAAGQLEEEDETRNKKRRRVAEGDRFGGRILFDLGFDDKMSDKEVASLCAQLAYSYSANRNAAFPFDLYFSSLNGRTHTRLEATNDAAYRRWKGTEWWEGDYSKLWHSDSASQQTVVYLTADSDEELTELIPSETYIIGGLCDHNRYKNLCRDKAATSGIRTARLPIGRYLASLPTRKVLTINQVVEIMLCWVQTRDWEDAFKSIIPKRKFLVGGMKVGEEEEKHRIVFTEAEIFSEPMEEPDEGQEPLAPEVVTDTNGL